VPIREHLKTLSADGPPPPKIGESGHRDNDSFFEHFKKEFDELPGGGGFGFSSRKSDKRF